MERNMLSKKQIVSEYTSDILNLTNESPPTDEEVESFSKQILAIIERQLKRERKVLQRVKS